MMAPEERTQKIESYGSGFELLITNLKQFPKEMWQFKPVADRWSIHEIIAHIATSEINSYRLYCRLIATVGSAVPSNDEEKRIDDLNSSDHSIDEALELIKKTRHTLYDFLVTLPESAWLNAVIQRQGNDFQLEDWLQLFERHIPEHIEQMRANLDVWLKQTKSD